MAPAGPAGAAPLRHLTGPTGTITYAEPVGTTPTYLFPLYDGSNTNAAYFQTTCWLPLYSFGSNSSPNIAVDGKLSLAKPPVLSNDNKKITIVLKKYDWSTGAPVTSRDLVFWMNIMLNEKTNFSNYRPGGWMDHVASYSAPSPSTFVLDLSTAYSTSYLVDDALSVLVPIPQQAWDKTSATSLDSNYDQTAAGAKEVYKYLNQQSKSLSTWDTNPLWQVVDGPWRIEPGTGFQVTGQLTFVPNTHYSGPNKPKAAEFEKLPFTSASAEFNALRSGSIDYGYVPSTDVGQVPALKSSGFKVEPWTGWGVSYITINYSNPRDGDIVKQLYVRQAMQMLIDQPEYIKTLLGGYGTPTYGPVPTAPKSPYLSPSLRSNPYPYDPAKATHLLEAHGWSIGKGGVARCTKPGSGSHHCGAGIARGTSLDVSLTYASGTPSVAEEVQAMKTSFEHAGIDLVLKEGPLTTVVDATFECQGKPMSKCSSRSPMLSYWGSPSYQYSPDYYPTGETLFACGAATNDGNYCNHTVEALINRADGRATATSLRTFHQLDVLLAKQLPVLWMPNAPVQISAISPKLGGVKAQDASGDINAATWFVKS